MAQDGIWPYDGGTRIKRVMLSFSECQAITGLFPQESHNLLISYRSRARTTILTRTGTVAISTSPKSAANLATWPVRFNDEREARCRQEVRLRSVFAFHLLASHPFNAGIKTLMNFL